MVKFCPDPFDDEVQAVGDGEAGDDMEFPPEPFSETESDEGYNQLKDHLYVIVFDEEAFAPLPFLLAVGVFVVLP